MMETIDETFDRVCKIWDETMINKDPIAQSFGFPDSDSYADMVALIGETFKKDSFLEYLQNMGIPVTGDESAQEIHEMDNDAIDKAKVALVLAEADMILIFMMFARERERLADVESRKE